MGSAAKRVCRWRVHGRTECGQGSRDVFEKASMNAPAVVQCMQEPGCVWFGAVAVYAARFTCPGDGMHNLVWRCEGAVAARCTRL